MENILNWGHAALQLRFGWSEDGPVSLVSWGPERGEVGGDDPQPLVEVLVAGSGREWSGSRTVRTAVGRRLRYVTHEESIDGLWHQLVIEMRDVETGLHVDAILRSLEGVPAVSVRTRLRAGGDEAVTVLGVSSFVGRVSSTEAIGTTVIHQARSDWLAEARWSVARLRDAGLPDIDLPLHGHQPRGCVSQSSDGSWSTGVYMPVGALVDAASGHALMWQIEHNGPWRWEVGEQPEGLYLALQGPTDNDHQWQRTVEPGGEAFESVPVTISVSSAGLEPAVHAMTSHRRASRLAHRDDAAPSVIYNDYMNTLNGDPTTEKLLPLIRGAAKVGAEYFCIDAGWYSDDDHWWDTVGEWTPSTTRFPGGLAEVIDSIRDHGMVPGLWLEPEVVGVSSPVAEDLPDEAFFQRSGRRHVEHGRYHLDLRHPGARQHLDETVDRLVADFGIGYFKLDYNVNPGVGTEHAAETPGDGLLGHSRAYASWIEGVRERHPEVILENCSSGAMRSDHALLSLFQLQSTSDQCDPIRYTAIAASSPMAILPEQSATWAYVQPEMSMEEIAYTMCNSLLGRLYLSGHIDRMSVEQIDLVRQGTDLYTSLRRDLPRSWPSWPLGLPAWNSGWIGLAMRRGEVIDVILWRRPGADPHVELELSGWQDQTIDIETLYPADLPSWSVEWDGGKGQLRVEASTEAPSSRMFRMAQR